MTSKHVRVVLKKGKKYLLVQRSYDYKFGGKWEFPGGKADMPGGIRDNARREVAEEVGLVIYNQRLLRKIYKKRTKAIIFFYTAQFSGKVILDRKENRDFGWFTKDNIKRLNTTVITKEFLKLKRRIKIGGKV